MADGRAPIRATLKRCAQVLLCAGALAGGAALSAITAPEGSAPPAALASAPSLVATRAPDEAAPYERPSLARDEERPDLGPIDVPLVPLRPFAEPLRDGLVITGATRHRILLFTFDDGPDTRNTPRLLETLDHYGIKAVFFLTASRIAGEGPWQRRNQAVARDIVARGHIVANHTLDHAQLPLLDEAGVIAQVVEAEAIFERVLGERTWLMRPPGGGRSPRVDGILARHGYTQLLWNLGTGDFQVREPEEVARVFRRVLEVRERDYGERGGVVLLHDTHAWSVDAVPLIVSWIREQNCRLLETDEELYDIVGDPRIFYRPRQGESPSAAAPPAVLDPATLAARQRALREETQQRCERLAAR